MGKDKAQLLYSGLTSLERALRSVEPLCDAVWLASGTGPRYLESGRECLLDRRPSGAGPLAGIEAGLLHARERAEASHLLVVACDMPLVTSALYRELLNRCLQEGLDFVGLRSASGPEPLCSVWSTRLVDAVQATLDAGQYKPLLALERGARLAWCDASPEQTLQAMNINTPADWQTLQEGRRG